MKLSFDSLCTKEYKEKRKNKPHTLPIYATSSFVFDDINHGMDIFQNKKDGHVYSRYANPTVETVEDKLAQLESYDTHIDAFALMTNSGMSAINTLFAGMLQQGDQVLTQGNLYGGTTELLIKMLGKFGVEAIFIDLTDEAAIHSAVAEYKNIRMIYAETPANPSMSCIDFDLIASIGKKHNIYTAVDSTFPTPYLQQPLKHGIDFVIHSTTKYLNGHGNSISGVIIGSDKSHKEKIWTALKLIGSNCSPFEAWLLHNGLKTLPLRMEKHCSNAMALAKYLDSDNRVKTVNYPGLESHESHAIASKQMKRFGGMLSFEIDGGIESGIQFMNKLKMAVLAPTLGDVDTLILHPASSSHINVDRELRIANGITDGLIRVSVGIESEADIIADIEQALG